MALLYSYVQSTPASTWNISHNLGCAVITDVTTVIDGSEQKILPEEVAYVDSNNISISFTSAVTGVARCIGLFQHPALTAGTIDGTINQTV